MAPSPRLRLPSPALPLALAALTVGCGWPRYSNLPDDTDVIDATEDPRSTVPVTFTSTTEDALAPGGVDNADPRNVSVTDLAMLGGVEVAGSLRGVGWNEGFEARPLEGDGCTSASASVDRTGDWAGDVDFVVVEVTEAGVLCADVDLGENLGWDLLLYPLDSANCDLPGEALSGPGGELLGFERGGQRGGWKTPVEAGLYGVLFAGYSAPDALGEYDYNLGVSLVPPGEGRELCPRLPSQGAAQ